MCEQGTVITMKINGAPRGIDSCIAPIVQALNAAGVVTLGSCCGHGHRPGNIILADGREIVLARSYEEGRAIDRMLPDIHGTRPDPAPLVLTPPERDDLTWLRKFIYEQRDGRLGLRSGGAIAAIDRLLALPAATRSPVRGGEANPPPANAPVSTSTSGHLSALRRLVIVAHQILANVKPDQIPKGLGARWLDEIEAADKAANAPAQPVAPEPPPLPDTIKRPKGCTCHQEIGDSSCDVHPSCDGCGELLDPDSEPRNWCGAVVCEPTAAEEPSA